MKESASKGPEKSKVKYQKTQIGWLMIIIFSLIIIHITLAYLLKIGDKPLSFNVYIILLSVFLLTFLTFYKLKIVVDSSSIHIIYGIGLVHIRIKPQKIHSVNVVKVPWIYGLGIRFTGKGMLYNIQGRDAVEISYFDGKKKTVLIGNDNPLLLKDFIEKVYAVEYIH